ncbi:MAG: 5'/3'-nucleotidase SurE [Deltaproteobacteria bacterium]|jgi:5'-nucleotidase|nr:5'/3'-nucleotidase SurE [Deltaproteobacteria bacterium]
MRVLLTNDDGLHSEGILTAYAALKTAGHTLTVCAPDRERSANSQCLTLREPLTVSPKILPDGATGYAVSGTPADCARLGLTALAKEPVELVVSGINSDFNLGYDVNYSGTVGAALEAASTGVMAVAISLEKAPTYNWQFAGLVLIEVANKIRSWAIPAGVALSVNVPHAARDQKIVWAKPYHQASRDYFQPLQEPDDPSPNPSGSLKYVRLRGTPFDLEDEPEYDISLVKAGWVTISPLVGVGLHNSTFGRFKTD